MKKARKNYSPQEKAAILRRHLVDRVPTAQICAQFQLQHAIFYRWKKQLFENAAVALKRRPTIGKRPDAIQDGSTAGQQKLRAFESREAELNWMISLAQGRFGKEQIKQVAGNALSQEDIGKLLACICPMEENVKDNFLHPRDGENFFGRRHLAIFVTSSPRQSRSYVEL